MLEIVLAIEQELIAPLLLKTCYW